MPPDNPFADLLRRIRAGDEDAAAELVHCYEPVIRREARLRLTDPGLTRLLDSSDVCQSVLLSFFVRAAAGQYELTGPQDLVRLLVTMVRNKVASHVRKLRRRPQDNRRVPGAEALALVADDERPTQRLVARDLISAVLGQMSAEERHVAELRTQGYSWPEVGAALGGGAEARRKQLERALDRVVRQLGLDEDP
jgi:RNA polymerase sigma-70 factor (ECF subfamily)